MIIEINIDQDDYDIVASQLRQTTIFEGQTIPGETVEGWVTGMVRGKISKCKKRADPVGVLTAENAVLRDEKAAIVEENLELRSGRAE